MGIAAGRFGITFAMLGLAAQYIGVAGGQSRSSIPTLLATSAMIVFAGLLSISSGSEPLLGAVGLAADERYLSGGPLGRAV